MKIWLVLALLVLGTNASWTDTDDCIEWAFEPTAYKLPDEFLGPKFEEGRVELLKPQTSITQAPRMPEDFYGPKFEEGPIEMLDTLKPVAYKMPDEFHGPKFDEAQIEMLVPQMTVTKAPLMPEDFYAPLFDEGRVELLEPPKTTSTQAPVMPAEFHGPKFEEGQVEMLEPQQTTTITQAPRMPDDFYAPLFEEGSIEIPDTPKPVAYKLPEKFYGPKFEEGRIEMTQPAKHYYPKKQQQIFVRDDFASRRPEKTIVEPIDVPSHVVEVQDEFVVRPKIAVEPKFVESRTEKKQQPAVRYHPKQIFVRDDFANRRSEKTIVESADVPSHAAEVQDEFVTESAKPKKVQRPKKEHSTFERVFGRPFYESGPMTQFFLDLVGAKAPVQDNFAVGVSGKTEVEPIETVPNHKAEVHDEFTFSDDDKDAYRSKRSADTSSDNTLWKKVCVKRLPKNKPRVLTAGDFLDAQAELNERIARCVGRFEGENVAAGVCRKYYLHCNAPDISVLMCSRQNEVFSEAMKQCVPKAGLAECDIKRTLRSRMISFSPNATMNESSTDKQKDIFQNNVEDFCSDRPDGFYRDDKDCARVLQCFDKELFEYPSCAAGLAFDVRRGVCDYREKVPSCVNN